MNLDELRSKFPITRNYNFQNHAAIAPMSAPAAEAMVGYAQELSEAAYLRGKYYRAAEHVRALPPGSSMPTRPRSPSSRTRARASTTSPTAYNGSVAINIVTTTMEFPANAYPWLVLEHRGVNVCRVEEEAGRVPFDRLGGGHQQPHAAGDDFRRTVVERFPHRPDAAGRAVQGKGRAALRGRDPGPGRPPNRRPRHEHRFSRGGRAQVALLAGGQRHLLLQAGADRPHQTHGAGLHVP